MTLDIRKLFSSGAIQGPNHHIIAWGGCMRPIKCRPVPWWARIAGLARVAGSFFLSTRK